jgi:hypothetical protein
MFLIRYIKLIFNKIKGLFRRSNIYLEPIYTDKLGNKYYKFVSPKYMSFKRLHEIQAYSSLMSMNVTRDKLIQYLQAAKSHLNSGKITECAAMIEGLLALAEFKAEEEVLLGLAAMYFPMTDEPLIEPDPIWIKRKVALWKQDPAAFGFFLRLAWEYTENSMTMSEEDMVKYLDETKMIMGILNAQLTELNKTTLTSTMPLQNETRPLE